MMPPSAANGSKVATMDNWYALMIHTDAAGDVCRSAAMAGSAVLAMAVSRVASETASRMAVIARRCCGVRGASAVGWFGFVGVDTILFGGGRIVRHDTGY